MKTYLRRITGLLVFAICIIPSASFGFGNDCAFANQYTKLIQSQTQLAIKAPSVALSKFYAYKAIKGLYKTLDNYKNCGCDNALSKLEEAEKNLKAATQTSEVLQQQKLLKTALKLTLQSLDHLEDFRKKENMNSYADDVLVMNVQSTSLEVNPQNSLADRPVLKSTIERKISDFKASIANLKLTLNCIEVKEFVVQVQKTTKTKLNQKVVTPGKQFYYNRMLETTYDELAELETCMAR